MARILVVLTIVLAVAATQAAPEGTFLTVDLDELAAALDADQALQPTAAPELPAPAPAFEALWRESSDVIGCLAVCDVFRPPALLT